MPTFYIHIYLNVLNHTYYPCTFTYAFYVLVHMYACIPTSLLYTLYIFMYMYILPLLPLYTHVIVLYLYLFYVHVHSKPYTSITLVSTCYSVVPLPYSMYIFYLDCIIMFILYLFCTQFPLMTCPSHQYHLMMIAMMIQTQLLHQVCYLSLSK